MRIYVDFDDCICETARDLSSLAASLFGKIVPYEEIAAFDLHEAFGLNDAEYTKLMDKAHSDSFVRGYKETEGAVAVLNSWLDRGYDVEIVTGRPFVTAKSSRLWLDEHGLSRLPIVFVDKYGREPPPPSPDAPRALSLDELFERKYDFAVEDAPAAFRHLTRFENCRVAVYSRPWNRRSALPSEAFSRRSSWSDIDSFLHNAG